MLGYSSVNFSVGNVTMFMHKRFWEIRWAANQAGKLLQFPLGFRCWSVANVIRMNDNLAHYISGGKHEM